MLNLHKTYPGCPSGGLHHLVLPQETLLLYPFADAVVILNARSLSLVRVLAFWEVFRQTLHTEDKVSCISVDSGMKLIVASMNSRIASWSLSGVQHDAWRVHSSLVLPPEHVVTTLHSKSGLLAIGTERGLSVHTLILDNDLPTWSQKWMVSLKATPTYVRFAPSLMYIATTSKVDNAVRLYSTTSGRQTQLIPHPRPVVNFAWRYTQASSRDDLMLYTVTSDSTLRIFLPVLDSPQHLQLHASLDLFSALPSSIATEVPQPSDSSVFWLDREVVGASLDSILKGSQDDDDVRIRRLREIKEEGWDLFLRVFWDGSVVVSAVANIDRRPPTLLRQFTLLQSNPHTLPNPPSHLYALPTPGRSSITLITSPPLTSYELDLQTFFDANADGLHLVTRGADKDPREELEILRFVRTPEGRGVGVIRPNGVGDAWKIEDNGQSLVRCGSWDSADHVVILDGGNKFATYTTSTSTLTLWTTPPTSIELPTIDSLFTLPSESGHESIIGITDKLSIVHVQLVPSSPTSPNTPPITLNLHSHSTLPLPTPPKMILPVDPMAWGQHHDWIEHDVLLSVSDSGELAFWVPEERKHTSMNGAVGPSTSDNKGVAGPWSWRCTGRVRTERTGIKRARCSSTKKSALCIPEDQGEELTIWDSKESEFASGLEYRGVFSDTITDLDWTCTPDMQSILAVGFHHHVELLCQQRMTYFDEGPGWAICWKIDISSFIPYSISDSIWLANGSLLVGAGHQMCLYGQSAPEVSSPAQQDSDESLFKYVTRQNGQLEDYHPQMLLQCLLWEKTELVKEIIVNLAKDIDNRMEKGHRAEWTSVPVERFMRKDSGGSSTSSHKKRYTMLFNGPDVQEDLDEEEFSRPLVQRLIENLEAEPLPHLTTNEQAHLLVLIQTTLEIDEQQRSLDSNGLRYLISMRSFYILNHRASAPGTPASNGVVARKTGRRERLRYRDIVWAFHSESQELLLGACTAACNGKMCWSDARALGVSIWLNSVESMKAHMEVIARNEYMAGEARDPTACSLFYFALGKVKLVHGLWRQAAWHKEQGLMLKFLSNDFTEPRWRTAALKNAYALLSKRRFEYAAAFFLLGGSLKDAVNVCIKQLQDFQLAIALARVVEQGNDGPVFLEILRNTVVPTAFRHGNRWLASWAFWLLHRRDLAVRILVTPLQDIATAFDITVEKIGEPHYDDPSLALLFSQLRSKTLQAAKGTSEISGRSEFNFVLQIARVFCRMGCHILALDLVRSWSFDRPTSLISSSPTISPSSHEVGGDAPLSPTTSRRHKFSLQPAALRRRSSMSIDMDMTSLPPTQTASPESKGHRPPTIPEEPNQAEDLIARKTALGNLMKSAKQDVKVPEFDMNAFF